MKPKNKQQNITSLLIVLHKVVYTVHTWLITSNYNLQNVFKPTKLYLQTQN